MMRVRLNKVLLISAMLLLSSGVLWNQSRITTHDCSAFLKGNIKLNDNDAFQCFERAIKHHTMRTSKKDSAQYYIEKGKQYFSSHEDPFRLIEIYLLDAWIEWYHGEGEAALEKNRKVLAMAIQKNSLANLRLIYNQISHSHNMQGKQDSALFYQHKSIEAMNKYNKVPFYSQYTSLAEMQFNAGLYQDAKESLEIVEENKDKLPTIQKYILLEKWIQLYGVGLKDYDKYAYYLKQAMDYAEKSNFLDERHLHSVFFRDMEMDDRGAFYEGTLLANYKVNNIRALAYGLGQTGTYYLDEDRLDDFARIYTYWKKKLNDFAILPFPSQVEMSQLYSRYLFLMGEYKLAYQAEKSFQSLRDSLIKNQDASAINELQQKYDLANKEKTIAEQQTDIEKKTNQRNLIILISALMLTLLVFLFQRNRKNKQLSLKEKELSESVLERMKKEKQITGLASLIEGQESERNRIAKDLHDGLGGLLAAASTSLSAFHKNGMTNGKIDHTKRLIDQACSDVRRISYDLMPTSLEVAGLQTTVESMVERFRSVYGLQIDLDYELEDKQLNKSTEISMYRIIQESMNNIIKHSEADHILLQISHFESELVILIEDNGKGFNKKSITKGIGLKSIQNRVDVLGGSLDIDSRVGEGTSLTINIPMKASI